MNTPKKQIENGPIKMNPESSFTLEEAQLTEALTSFRQSMHAWSEHELNRRPAAPLSQPQHRHWLIAPAMTWAAAAALALAAVGVPIGMHRHHEAVAHQRQLEAARQQQLQEQQRAAQLAANKAEDDQLLEHVDTDIAQDTPDAMQPLASLMSNSGAE